MGFYGIKDSLLILRIYFEDYLLLDFQRSSEECLGPCQTYQGFFLRHWQSTGQQGKGGDHLFITPLYHFHSLSDIQIFICNFACEMTTTYFLIAPLLIVSHRLYLPECYLTRLTTLLNYHVIDLWWKVNFYLLTWQLTSNFFSSVWHRKPVDLNSHRLSASYYK